MIKKIAYGLLNLVTLGRGIKRNFEGNVVRLPTQYYRYFPEGYERENFLFLNQHLKPGMNVIDVGAHIGLMSVAIASKVGASGKVYAFEPTPTTVNILKHTIRLNKVENIFVEPVALSDKKGTMTFYISNYEADNSNSLVNNDRRDRDEKSIEVEVNTIDDFVKDRKISRLDFLKIDAEGAELHVLKGASSTIAKDKPPMILSIHPASIKNFGDSQESIWDMLHDWHYNIIVDGKAVDRNTFSSRTDLFEVYLT